MEMYFICKTHKVPLINSLRSRTGFGSSTGRNHKSASGTDSFEHGLYKPAWLECRQPLGCGQLHPQSCGHRGTRKAEVAALATTDSDRGWVLVLAVAVAVVGGLRGVGFMWLSPKTAALIFQGTTSTSGDSEAVFVCVGGCWLEPLTPDLTATPRAQRHSSAGVPPGKQPLTAVPAIARYGKSGL